MELTSPACTGDRPWAARSGHSSGHSFLRRSTSSICRVASLTMPFLSGCFTSARQVLKSSSSWFMVAFSSSRRFFSLWHLFLKNTGEQINNQSSYQVLAAKACLEFIIEFLWVQKVKLNLIWVLKHFIRFKSRIFKTYRSFRRFVLKRYVKTFDQTFIKIRQIIILSSTRITHRMKQLW